MGYYTKFSLEIEAPNELEEIFGQDADGNPTSIFVEKKVDRLKIEVDLQEEVGYNPLVDECKWCKHEKDMRTLSRKYSGVLFILTGEGEVNGDLWKKYFKNGKMQSCKAKITYDEFDERKLV